MRASTSQLTSPAAAVPAAGATAGRFDWCRVSPRYCYLRPAAGRSAGEPRAPWPPRDRRPARAAHPYGDRLHPVQSARFRRSRARSFRSLSLAPFAQRVSVGVSVRARACPGPTDYRWMVEFSRNGT